MKKGEAFEEEPYRFVVAAVYLLACLVNFIPVNTFSSINVVVEETFRISDIEVTLNGLLFTIMHPLFAVPFNYLIGRYGMRPCFLTGALLVVAGVWLRLLLREEQSVFCLLGSLLAAIGNIFVLNTPSKVALNWFSKKHIGIVTFTGVLIAIISNTAGAAVPSFIIKKDTPVEDIRKFLMVEAIVVTVPYILLVIFFRERPDRPPSKAAMASLTRKEDSYKSILKELFKNGNYLKLLLAMAMSYGTLTALLMVLDQMLTGFGYGDDSGQVTSVTIASAMVFGVVSNPLFSLLLRKTKAYRAVIAFNMLGGFAMGSLLLFSFTYQVRETWKVILLGGFTGFFTLPAPSIVISYASEVVFPIDEGSSAGFLFAASQTFGFLLGFGSISYLNKSQERSRVVAYVCMGLFLLSVLASLWVRQDLRKLRFQKTEYRSQSRSQYSRHSEVKNSLLVQQDAAQ